MKAGTLLLMACALLASMALPSVAQTGGPEVVSLSPTSGTGLEQIFTAVYTTTAKTQLSNIRFLMNTSITGVKACYIFATVFSGAGLYLENDANDGTFATYPSGPPVSNSQCTLEDSNVAFSGFTVTLYLKISFNSSFLGSKSVYLSANTTDTTSGWVDSGTWTPTTNGPPAVVSVSPDSGTGSAQTFTADYSDPNGAADLTSVRILFNPSTTGVNGCYVSYLPISNQLYLENSADNGTTGPITPGSQSTLSNDQCTLNGNGTTVSKSGSSITVGYSLTFSAGFTGSKNIYLSSNSSSASSGWVHTGTWTP